MIIAIVNQKGGTGKTTTTVNLGSALARSGKKVLLIDLDAQGNLSYSLGIVDVDKSLSDLFEGSVDFSDIIHEREGMDVLPSNVQLAEIELSISDVEERESQLKYLLKDCVNAYDYILIDCPPSLSLLTVNALNSADGVIIPMQMEVLSLQGLDLIMETIEKVQAGLNPSLKILGILPVMVDSRRKLSTEVHEHISENYNAYVFGNKIRNNVKASEAPSFGESVLSYAPSSNSAKDYFAFADEFLQSQNS